MQQNLKAELSTELDNILNFWIESTIDVKNGGFIGEIDGNNIKHIDAPKGSVLNARLLWTFSSAYRITGKEEYLRQAQYTFDYFKHNFIDKKYGGVYWELNADGTPSNRRKQIYAIAFAIYGLSEFFRATQANEALNLAVGLFNNIEKYSFDASENGYFEALTEEWELLDDVRLSPKDYNERKTMNTHLHIMEAYACLYRVYKTDKVATALKNLINLFLDKFINDQGNLNLFFDDDWNLKSDIISFGHDIECSWLLHEAAEVLGNEELLKKVIPVSIKIADVTYNGIDTDNGLFYELEKDKNHLDTDKHWWPQAEALVGYYNVYELSKDEKYLQTAADFWEFTKENIIDKKHGEWFWRVSKDRVPYESDEKVGFWKCPYHNSRACMELMERIK